MFGPLCISKPIAGVSLLPVIGSRVRVAIARDVGRRHEGVIVGAGVQVT
jgi:hypothetical protein